MSEPTSIAFGKWRSFFWPVHRWEVKKVVPMLLVFFLIAFNYNLLRAYKDTIVVTSSNSGVEAIPFIKVWAVLPSAILFTFFFTRLSNRFSREHVFYITLSIFLGFFALFAFVLYPARDILHPNALADQLQGYLPAGFKGLIAIFRHWTFTLFYVMSELWSTTIFTVLFWGFANEVTNVTEAKRFYGIVMTGGNIAGMFSGQAAIWFSGDLFYSWIPYGKTAWDQSILFLTCALLGAGLLTMLIFRWLNVHVINPVEKARPEHLRPPKIRMSMRENFAYLARSKYLICIALIVLGYNLAMNLIEVVWKNQMKVLYPNPSDYNTYMGQVLFVMAVVATLAGLATTTNVIRRYSWTISAMISPIIVCISGVAFFALVMVQQSGIHWFATLFGATPLVLSVTLGSIQNCLSRAAKYTLFDATKEIAFIPLSNESKLKGKAAIDGVGSRLGKSGGAVIHQGLILIFSTVATTTPYVAAAFLGVVLLWGLAVISLGKQFDQVTQRAHDIRKDPAIKPV
jgi:AAA family ATP:ADP antiporter